MTPLEELQAELKKAQEELDNFDATYVDNKHIIIERIEALKKRIRAIGPCRVKVRHCVPFINDLELTFEDESEARVFINKIVDGQGLYHDINISETAFIPIGSITYIRIARII